MRFFYFTMILLASVFVISCGGSDEGGSDACSKDNLTGKCDGDNVCIDGSCQVKPEDCSDEYPDGYCAGDKICKAGVCTDKPNGEACSEDNLNGACDDDTKYCDAGRCVDKLNQYKLGAITQTIDIESRPNQLLNEYHYEIMDITGRNKRRVTNDIQSCINKDSCWASPNYKYFTYLKSTGSGAYSLSIVDIPSDFQTNFAQSSIVTNKLVGEPFFLNDGVSFLYVENTSPNAAPLLMIKKYNMSTKTSTTLTKFSVEKTGKDADNNDVLYEAPASHFVVSSDNKVLVFDLDYGYNNPVELYSLDLNNPSTPPILFYKYARVSKSGKGLKWGAISKDNKVLAFISSFDLKHRLHLVHLDKSDLLDDGGDPNTTPLGKYIGPLDNACPTIEGVQLCDIKSELVYSKDDKFLYFAGRVDGGTDLSPLVNIYKFDVVNDTLIKLTANTDFEDVTPFQSMIFNTETDNAVYTMAQQGAIKNHDAHYLNLNSTEPDMGSKLVGNTREGRELKLFFLKQ